MRHAPLVALLLLPACYRYVPDPSPSASPGMEARLVLTPTGTAALTPTLGRETTGVEGRVTSASDTAYIMSVSATLKRDRDAGGLSSLSRTTWAGELVTIPRVDVAGTERRHLDSRRTAIAAGVASAVAVLAVRMLVHGSGSSGGGDTGGTGPTP